MLYTVLKAEIIGATVTDANLDYIGSIAVDSLILKASGILPNEEVRVWNNTTGARLTTYALEGGAGTGVICINGAGAHLFAVGNNVSIAAFCQWNMEEDKAYAPVIIQLDRNNRVVKKASA